MEDGNPRLYVGNLPYVAQKADIEKLFADNNIAIKSIDISIDSFTGRNPSYCFVDFNTEADAAEALSTLQGQMVRGRPIKVNLKTEKPDQYPDRRPTKVYDRGWEALNVPTPDAGPHSYAYDRWSRNDAASRWTAPHEEGRRLHVSGLPRIPNQDVVNAEMRVLFEDWKVEAVSKILSPHVSALSTPGSHHYCFVDLPTAQDAKAAILAKDGTATPYGGTYRVSVARQAAKPTKVEREQLGIQGVPGRARPGPAAAPARDLSGSWRKAG